MVMNHKEMLVWQIMKVLYSLIDNWEDEIIEFKEAENNYKQNEIGQYFSAISNEANLHGLQYGCFLFKVSMTD